MSDDHHSVSLPAYLSFSFLTQILSGALLLIIMLTPQTFLSSKFPEARAGLRPGATDDQIASFEACLEVKIPASLRVLYK